MPNVNVPLPDAGMPVTPKTSDKVVAAGMYLANTGIVAGAPLLNNLNPNINPSNAGGIAVSMIGDGITTIVQGLRMFDWFDDHKYAVWACIALSIIVCMGLYLWALHNPEQGVLNSLGSMYKAWSNYGPLNKLGVAGVAPADTTSTTEQITIEVPK